MFFISIAKFPLFVNKTWYNERNSFGGKTMHKKLARTPALLAIPLLSILGISLLIGYTFMSLRKLETPVFLHDTMWFAGAALLLYSILAIVIRIALSERVKIWHIILVFSVLYTAFGIYMITLAPSGLRADVWEIFNIAKQFTDTGSIVIPRGSYLYIYPHQLGLLTLFRLLGSLANAKGLFAANLLCVLLIQVLQIQISTLLFQNEQSSKLTAILSYFFLPVLFFILFAYNVLFSLFFALLGTYFLLRFTEKNRHFSAVLSVVFFAISVLLRSNILILLIALCIMLALKALQDKKAIYALMAILIMSFSIVSGQMLRQYYENKAKQDLPGMPSIAWVNLGIHYGNNGEPGMYSKRSWNLYETVDFDPEKLNMLVREEISTRLTAFTSKPEEAFTFFLTKIRSTWTDPLFQSIWSGPLSNEFASQKIEKPSLLASIYDDSTLYKLIALAMRALLLSIYVLSALGLWKLLKNNQLLPSLYIPLYFLGGFLFHLLWETKSQYVVSHVFMLIPIAGFGLSQFLTLLAQKKKARNTAA